MKNTIIEYTYRDGANYKIASAAILKGPASDEQIEEIRSAARQEDASSDYGDFIPGLVGLKDLQDSFVSPSYWDPETDHPLHIIDDVRSTDSEPNVDMTVEDFVSRMQANRDWDLEYVPPFYPAMEVRYQEYIEAEGLEEPEDPGMGPWGGM